MRSGAIFRTFHQQWHGPCITMGTAAGAMWGGRNITQHLPPHASFGVRALLTTIGVVTGGFWGGINGALYGAPVALIVAHNYLRK